MGSQGWRAAGQYSPIPNTDTLGRVERYGFPWKENRTMQRSHFFSTFFLVPGLFAGSIDGGLQVRMMRCVTFLSQYQANLTGIDTEREAFLTSFLISSLVLFSVSRSHLFAGSIEH